MKRSVLFVRKLINRSVAVFVAALEFVVAPVSTSAAPAPSGPISALHYLVGPWTCSYRAGATRMAYRAVWTYDRDGHTLRETTTFSGGGDEELLGYDAKHGGWTAVVFEDGGAATVLQAAGREPNRISYRSIYPDASIAETFERISATEYRIHATVRVSGKTIASADACTHDRP